MKNIKSFKLWYNPKFNPRNPYILLESKTEGNNEEGRCFEYFYKKGEIFAELKTWGYKKGYYTTDGHPMNQTFHLLPRDKWTTFSNVEKAKWGNGTKITDIVFE